MSTNKNQPQTITENDLHNLELLKSIFDFGQTFTAHAKSINDLFYLYIQTCLHRSDDILLTESDVYNIKEIVTALNDFKSPTQ